jgi:hypothetical protein
MSYRWLPKVLAEIAEVAGLDAALRLAEVRGGTQVYIPPDPPADHWLVEAVGPDAARAISSYFAGGGSGSRVDLPLGPRGAQARMRGEVDRMIAAGKSEREIALATGYTCRGVRRRRARLRDERQLQLL